MKRALKIIGLILVLFVVAIASIPLWLDMDVIRQQIQQQVKNATGRTLEMGELKLSFYPYLGFKAADIRFSNAPGFGSAPMAEMDNLGASIAVLPLLKGNLEVKEFVLDNPRILLATRKDGSNNWTMARVDTAPTTAAQSTATPSSSPVENSASAIKGISLNNVRLKNGELTFISPDGTHQLKGIHVDVNLPALDGTATIEGKVTYDQSEAIIEASLSSPALLLAQEATAYTLKASYGDIKADIAGTLWPRNFTKPELTFTRLQAETPAVKAIGTGRLNANLTGAKPYLSGELNFDEVALVSAPNTDRSSGPAVKGQPNKASDFAWSTEPLSLDGLFAANADLRLQIARLISGKVVLTNVAVPLRLNNGRAHVEPYSFEAFGTTFRGNLRLDANDTPTLNIGSNFSGLSLQTIAQTLAEDIPVAGDASFDLSLQGRGHSVAEMVKTLSGPLNFTLERAGLEGVDANTLLQKHAGIYGQALATHLDADAIKRLNQRESSLKLSTMANSGILDVRELAFKSPVVTLQGKGNINLPQTVMNVRCVPQVVAPVKTHSRTLSTALNTMKAPFFVQGSLFAPEVKIDEKALAQQVIEKSVQGGVQKALEKLDKKEDANPALKEGLKVLQGLFGKPEEAPKQ